jgi:hypothetical protein
MLPIIYLMKPFYLAESNPRCFSTQSYSAYKCNKDIWPRRETNEPCPQEDVTAVVLAGLVGLFESPRGSSEDILVGLHITRGPPVASMGRQYKTEKHESYRDTVDVTEKERALPKSRRGKRGEHPTGKGVPA